MNVSSHDPLANATAPCLGVGGLFRWFRGLLSQAQLRATQVMLVDVAQWRAVLPAAGALLDSAEAERVARKRFTKDREVLLLTYALHRMWLAAMLDCAPTQVPLRRDERGRPFVLGARLQTSLSHCDDAIALAVSFEGEIGVDIEPRSRASEMLSLASHVGHPQELMELAQVQESERGEALLRLWVRKEALLKAVGVGLGWEMTGFEAPAGRLIGFGQNGAPALQVTDLESDSSWAVGLATPPAVAGSCFWLSPGS